MRSEYKQLKFFPSGRNSGGRNQIEKHHRNHLTALQNTQPAINTRKPPKPHVDNGRVKKIGGPRAYLVDEVGETYRRVTQLKHGFTDNSEPKSYKMMASLQRKHSVQQEVERTYHQNHISSLMRNIITIQSRSEKKIDTLLNKSRLLKVEQHYKETSRKSKAEWDTRSSHPLEAEWKAQRPKSAKSRGSISTAHRTTQPASLANFLQFDSSTFNFSKFSHISPSQHYIDQEEEFQQRQEIYAMDQTDALSSYQPTRKNKEGFDSDFENQIIDQYEEQSMTKKQDDLETNELKGINQIGKVFQLYDKRTKSYRNITIPLVQSQDESKLYRLTKRLLMQLIMDYKVNYSNSLQKKIFQRELIFQLGKCLVQRNTWLDEIKVLDICKDIAKNLYGYCDT